MPFQGGDQSAADGAGKHRAADHDHVVIRLLGQGGADFAADVFHVLVVQAAVSVAGRGYADQANVAVQDGLADR